MIDVRSQVLIVEDDAALRAAGMEIPNGPLSAWLVRPLKERA
jgi:hypothetical protein